MMCMKLCGRPHSPPKPSKISKHHQLKLLVAIQSASVRLEFGDRSSGSTTDIEA